MSSMTREEATAVRKYARKIYNMLREDGEAPGVKDAYASAYRSGHPSHAANKALEVAATRYGVGYGTDGFCGDCGGYGITYVNMGDTYDTTVYFNSDTGQFRIGDYGTIIENAPEGRYR